VRLIATTLPLCGVLLFFKLTTGSFYLFDYLRLK